MVNWASIVGVVVVIVLVTVALIAVYAMRYKKVPPNHAMVLFGRRYGPSSESGSGMYVWMSGGKFILPIVESYALLSLAPIEIGLHVGRVRLDVKGALPRDVGVDVKATMRVPPEKEEIEKAARHFLQGREFMPVRRSDEAETLRKTEEAMKGTVSAVLERHARSVVARLPADTPEAEIADAVSAAAAPDLATLGVRLVSLVTALTPAGEPRQDVGSAGGDLAAELQRVENRLRRIEERLGLTPPA